MFSIVFCSCRYVRPVTNICFSTKVNPNPSINVSKVVNVAIIGAPNSGKSTLINQILGRKICAASNKVHTTTKLDRAMCVENDTQIIFLDTPGVVTSKEQKKYNLPDSMIKAYFKSLNCANVIGVVHDVSNRWTMDVLHRDVASMLEECKHIPSFLILNKVDQFKNKKMLLDKINNLTNGIIAEIPTPHFKKGNSKKEIKPSGYSHFSDVFMVSALNGDGVSDIKNYILSNAKPANIQFSTEKWSDKSPEKLIEDAVRAKFLDFLSEELPYILTFQIEHYEENDKKIQASVIVECPTERKQRLIAGAGGGRLKKIESYVRQDLIEMFKKLVQIDIELVTKKKTST